MAKIIWHEKATSQLVLMPEDMATFRADAAVLPEAECDSALGGLGVSLRESRVSTFLLSYFPTLSATSMLRLIIK